MSNPFILETLEYRYHHNALKSLEKLKKLLRNETWSWDEIDNALDALNRDESREQILKYVKRIVEREDGIKKEPTLFKELDEAEVENEEWQTVQ
tara:strand:- start:377 stop:658 length:282 start_codon:yes stop_codon:yes gene_type:complete